MAAAIGAKQISEARKGVELDISRLYGERAKLDELEGYVSRAKALVPPGAEVILTGAAPVWLYLKVAHALHGIAARLTYRSPVTGDVVIFDHRPD